MTILTLNLKGLLLSLIFSSVLVRLTTASPNPLRREVVPLNARDDLEICGLTAGSHASLLLASGVYFDPGNPEFQVVSFRLNDSDSDTNYFYLQHDVITPGPIRSSLCSTDLSGKYGEMCSGIVKISTDCGGAPPTLWTADCSSPRLPRQYPLLVINEETFSPRYCLLYTTFKLPSSTDPSGSLVVEPICGDVDRAVQVCAAYVVGVDGVDGNLSDAGFSFNSEVQF